MAEETPILRELSWKEVREYTLVIRHLAILEMKRDAAVSELDANKLDEIEVELNEWVDKQRAITVRCIKYLPKSWLVDDAPEKLDWNDPKSLEYLKTSKIRTLNNLIQGIKVAADEEGKD